MDSRYACAILLLIASTYPPAASACSQACPTPDVGTNFRILVTDRGRPVHGLIVELRNYERNSFESEDQVHPITDEQGIAEFRGRGVWGYLSDDRPMSVR